MSPVAYALELENVSRSYGSLKAVDDVSFAVDTGARHAVIGPNGAGKSTLFSVLAGTLRATAGRILLHGRDVTDEGEAGRCRLGLARTFQHSSVFLTASVLDNVTMAAQQAAGVSLRPFPLTRRFRAVTEAAFAQVQAVGLADRFAASAGSLSHGERRQLEVAMVLASRPDVVLFDEPTAGMSPAETHRFAELVAGLPPEITVLVIEHDLDVVFSLATAVTVLHLGRVLASGPPAVVQADPAVQSAYLGAASGDALFLTPGGTS
ncbi:MAG: branched-chain amino acid transport system ATP-binding protein [Actinomycetota bacterium]|nr:branched-chain amino acid transport system ATP-binding protein [Actinomycetota bacterium]